MANLSRIFAQLKAEEIKKKKAQELYERRKLFKEQLERKLKTKIKIRKNYNIKF